MKANLLATTRFTSHLASAVAALLTVTTASAEVRYWDPNGGGTFGNVTGTDVWATVGIDRIWTNSDIGGTTRLTPAYVTTFTDDCWFGGPFASLGGGMIPVETVNAKSLTFGVILGTVVLSGGTITLPATSSITVNSVSSQTISSTLAGAGTSLTKLGTGTLLLSGPSTYTGSTRVSAGTLTLGNSLAMQNSALDTLNTIVGTGSAGLGITVTALTLGGLTGDKDLSSVFTTASGGYTGLIGLTLNPGTGVTYTYSASAGNGNSSMTFTKSGPGTQILSGANTYTGNTVIESGTLLVNSPGSLNALSAISVNGGTLGGNGTIGGSVTIAAAGNVTPGTSASAGTLSIGGNLDISAPANGGTGKLNFELGPGANSDKIAVTGTLAIGSGVLGFSDFVFTGLTGLNNGTYKLITNGGVSGSLAASGLTGAVGDGGTGTLQITGNDLELVVTGIDDDGDGLPNSYELAHTTPPSSIALNPNDDLENGGAGDGLTNLQEYQHDTNPNNPDTDGDGITDGAEVNYAGSFFKFVPGSLSYPQAVGDAATQHGRVASFPNPADFSRMAAKARQATQGYVWIGLSDTATEGTWRWTDGSTATYSRWLAGQPSGGVIENHVLIMQNTTLWADATENYVAAGYLFERVGLDPLAPDTDSDGLTDSQEINTTNSNPFLDDTDGDGLSDGAEVNTHGSSPLLTDTDSDGINDSTEVEIYHTNPAVRDSDGDGFDDLFEINAGFDPNLNTSTPNALTTNLTAVELRSYGLNGVSYRIESSTDLATWTTVEPTIIGTGAVITRFYSIENQPKRYFRVMRN